MDQFFEQLKGRVVTLSQQHQQTPFGSYTVYLVNDEDFLKTINSREEIIRLMVPNMIHTMDFNPKRVNIHINEQGEIFNISEG